MTTRAEIEAMTKEQLRLAIAEIIEPKPVYIPSINYVLWAPQYSEKGAWFCSADYSDGDEPAWFPENFPGNIKLAWLLVEEAKLSVLFPGGVYADGEYTNGDCYLAENGLVEARGETAPLAICRAYLAWKLGVTE